VQAPRKRVAAGAGRPCGGPMSAGVATVETVQSASAVGDRFAARGRVLFTVLP
jgi:hypothetical protein